MPSIEALEKLLAKDPNDAFVLYGLAQEYAKQRDAARAVEFFDRCLAADPSYCYAYYHKAKALAAAGDVAGAKAVIALGQAAAIKYRDGHAQSELDALLDDL